MIFGSGNGVCIFVFFFSWATVLGGKSALTTSTPLLPRGFGRIRTFVDSSKHYQVFSSSKGGFHHPVSLAAKLVLTLVSSYALLK